jgi:hypothetical protein
VSDISSLPEEYSVFLHAVMLQADITQDLALFGYLKLVYICMYVWQISFNRDLACVKDSTYTGQTQTQRKFRHTFIP